MPPLPKPKFSSGRKQKHNKFIMKKVYTILAIFATITTANAKTYSIGSGKWTDALVWNGQYIGSTIKADDVVIITGQITMNTSIVVEGTLRVEKGAGMVGMKDLVVAKTGTFVNNGNTVMKRILNEGFIKNNMSMEAMMDIENKSNIENNNMISGDSFDNFGGTAEGNNGSYYINNNINTSPASKFGADVKVFYGNANQSEATASSAMNAFSRHILRNFGQAIQARQASVFIFILGDLPQNHLLLWRARAVLDCQIQYFHSELDVAACNSRCHDFV